jgi:hypothetical protein
MWERELGFHCIEAELAEHLKRLRGAFFNK